MNQNRLGREKSPYLLQHKDNPIAWYAWGKEAFVAARRDNKPIFLSVGYSTCHWCHVMAHESFEDAEVAEVLNADFISIKVDREERPDVDDVYMRALQNLSGGGGWPMSVWLTPDGKPFFAGTYFPKYRFLQLLRRVREIWAKEPNQLLMDGDRLTAALSASSEVRSEDSQAADWEESLSEYISHFQFHYDERFGGFGRAPKFPPSMSLMLMMRQDLKSGLNQAEAMVNGTLQNMMRGGIYDQLCGGFHRYSVDEQWLVPHFEKMLYDQALISVALIDAFQMYGDTELARAARETLEYVGREMTSSEGGFYSAQDADSFNPNQNRKEEGYFSTFSYEELKELLTSEELDILKRAYGLSPQGNFEGRSILHLQDGFDGQVLQDPILKSAFAKLRTLRSSRPAPHVDDKVIASWNGWMIWAFARAARAFQEALYLERAQRALRFIREKMWVENKLSRFWRDGQACGEGTSEDFCALIHACLELHQADLQPEWIQFAMELQHALDHRFWDPHEGAYFTNDGTDPYLPVRTKEDYDGVTPSSNSMAALNLVRLYLLSGQMGFKDKAERIFARQFPQFKRYPSGHSFLGLAVDTFVFDTKVAVLSQGDWPAELKAELDQKYTPYVYWTKAESGWPVAAGKSDRENCIYVCEEGHCLRPATSKSEAIRQL